MKTKTTLKRTILSVAMTASALIGLTAPLAAQKRATPAAETPSQFEKRTRWWKEARFGMFIHWGIYSVPADSSRGMAEWYMSNFQMQVKDYEKFAPSFNPVAFDAKEWVQTAKKAGMKYIVITSKHHDGFDMFDSQVSDYTIVKSTPFQRDPLKELAEECRNQGVKLCFYHSIMDWRHPDYLPRRSWERGVRSAEGADFSRYIVYLKAQLKELVTKYRPAVLWFDGEWENTWTHEMGADLYRYVRSLDPHILVNNRVDKGRSGMQGMNVSNEFMGDFGTPEQEVPAQGFKDGRLWETCMTLNDTWGYARNDRNWKSQTVLIRHLADIAGKGGNFLLNVGPTNLGEFTMETKNRLEAIGRWMDGNGRAIYGTNATPFAKLNFAGTCTQKGNRLYVFVYDWGASASVALEGLLNKVKSAKVLATNERVAIQVRGSVLTLQKPSATDPDATVVELTLDGAPRVQP